MVTKRVRVAGGSRTYATSSHGELFGKPIYGKFRKRTLISNTGPRQHCGSVASWRDWGEQVQVFEAIFVAGTMLLFARLLVPSRLPRIKPLRLAAACVVIHCRVFAPMLGLVLSATVSAHDLPSRPSTILDWQTPQFDAVVTTYLPNYLGVNFIGGGGKVVDFEGKRCLQGNHFAFAVNNDYAYNIDEDVTLAIEFGRPTNQQSKTYVVVYDKNGGGDGVVSAEIPSKATQTIQLARARFADRGDLSTDFVIAGGAMSWQGVVTQPITICDLRLIRQANPSAVGSGSHAAVRADPASQALGKLKLRIVDENGDNTAVRLGIYYQSNRLVLPSGDAVAIRKFDQFSKVFLLPERAPWPMSNHYFYYAQGEYHVSLPAGRYTLVASKGLEYRFVNRLITVEANQASDFVINLQRWRDLRQNGWYSGDVHVHSVRSDAHFDNDRDNKALSAQSQAADLQVANILQMGNIAVTVFDQSAWGTSGRHQSPGTILVSGQEDPRTDLRGHTSHLNIKAPVRFPERYLLYHEVFEQVAQQGGISGYAHVLGPGGGVIEGLAMDVPAGLVSFVEILQQEFHSTEIWFEFLNLGFRLAPAAGSDYPFGRDYPGDVRNYVHVDGEFTVDAWFENLAAGRTYVSNGPFLWFQLNDKGMGEEAKLSSGESINIDVTALLNPDIDSLARIELIEQGAVVAVATPEFESDGHQLTLNYTSKAQQGTWFVVNAYGKGHQPLKPLVATSAPIYVSVDGDKFWRKDSVEEIVHRLQSRLLALRNRDELQWEGDFFRTEKIWHQQWPTQKKLLNQRIDWAVETLDQLILSAVMEKTD